MPESLGDLYKSIAASEFNQTIGGGDPEAVGGTQSKILLDLVGMSSAQTILDYGCGIGRTMPALFSGLANPSAQLDGCDISEDFLGECKRLYKSYGFRFYKIHAENEHYEKYKTTTSADLIPQEFYDYAYSFSVFTHFDFAMTATTLSFIHALLKPGGRYFLTMFRIDQGSRPILRNNTSPVFTFQQKFAETDIEYFAVPNDRLAFAALEKYNFEREISKAKFKIVTFWEGAWRGVPAGNIHDAYLIEKL